MPARRGAFGILPPFFSAPPIETSSGWCVLPSLLLPLLSYGRAFDLERPKHSPRVPGYCPSDDYYTASLRSTPFGWYGYESTYSPRYLWHVSTGAFEELPLYRPVLRMNRLFSLAPRPLKSSKVNSSHCLYSWARFLFPNPQLPPRFASFFLYLSLPHVVVSRVIFLTISWEFLSESDRTTFYHYA